MAAKFYKPKGMTYTQLCIWIDNNFYKPDCDKELAFKYMYIIAYMLASKAKYFTNIDDYDGYASYLAYSTYQRMSNPNKIPLRSVLNYMKKIMRFRKIAYLKTTFSEVIDSDYNKNWNGDLYTEKTKQSLESRGHDQLQNITLDLLNSIPKSVKNSIPKVYSNNKVLSHNLYLSALLTLLSSFVLPNKNEAYLESKQESSPTFNNANYYNKYLDDDLILWHLPSSMENTVILIINKVKRELFDDLQDIISDSKMSEDEYKNIFNDLIFGENDEPFENN